MMPNTIPQTSEEEFDNEQLHVIDKCCDVSVRIVAVTGQAGTGKTTLLKRVYHRLINRGLTVALCAPTGKAAKRIFEATGIPAQTIHRLLAYPHPGERDAKTGKVLVSTDPQHDRNNPIPYDVVLCDEYAMVNVSVHRNLLDALPNGGIIRMFGDANQLQPIETNKRLQAEDSSFLKMLNKFDGITLETIYRQEDGSSIISNGNRIIHGSMPKRADNFTIKITNKPVEEVLNFIQDNIVDDIDYGGVQTQIISPTRVGWVGCDALNSAIQQLLQPSSAKYMIAERNDWSKIEEQRFYLGDKVIYTTNNYSLPVFNGEIGVIIEITSDDSIVVDFGDKELLIPTSLEMIGKYGAYNKNPQKDLELAYVITTHKSQGSEYDRICYIMNKSRAYLLNRKNFYTAISRARSHVTIITDARSIDLSLHKKGDK